LSYETILFLYLFSPGIFPISIGML